LVDSSQVALDQAQAAAEERGLNLSLVCSDLRQYNFGRERFDLILVFFYLERALFPALEQSLRPGGILLYKTYTRQQLQFERGPRNPEHLLEPKELRGAFPGLRVLDYRESITDRAVAEYAGLRSL
jgi:SAM-dependent methyltransferase